MRRVKCWHAGGGCSVTATRKLLGAAEAAKVALSVGASTAISTPLCGDLQMTAAQLTAIAAPLMRRLGPPLARVAAETFLTWESWCAATRLWSRQHNPVLTCMPMFQGPNLQPQRQSTPSAP